MIFKVVRKIRSDESYATCHFCRCTDEKKVKYVIRDLEDPEFPPKGYYCCDECVKNAAFVELRMACEVNDITLAALMAYPD